MPYCQGVHSVLPTGVCSATIHLGQRAKKVRFESQSAMVKLRPQRKQKGGSNPKDILTIQENRGEYEVTDVRVEGKGGRLPRHCDSDRTEEAVTRYRNTACHRKFTGALVALGSASVRKYSGESENCHKGISTRTEAIRKNIRKAFPNGILSKRISKRQFSVCISKTLR